VAAQPGARRLAERLRQLRLEHRLTQEELAERASLLDAEIDVSVDTVRALERVTTPRPLPLRRPTGHRFRLELIIQALDVDLAEILGACFSEDELRQSAFAWVVDKRADQLERFGRLMRRQSLGDFVARLPGDAQSLLDLPGLVSLRNAEAFAYIFALEKCYPGLEMSLVDEPPIILLSPDDIAHWADGMRLDPDDRAVFIDLVNEYQEFFRSLALGHKKRYQVVLSKRGLERFLRRKSPEAARGSIADMVKLLRESHTFEMILADLPEPVEELEVISRFESIPTSFADTLSVVLRRSSMSSQEIEYSLVPMPPSIRSLQRDIAKIEQQWSIGLDQYRAMMNRTQYWMDIPEMTTRLLESFWA
jgi:transcriptional regulator with XRE-family HTH domain